ncbi:hypothetical protein ACA910_012768 [Epithemia clementina (nom. ined.)]
MSAKTDESKSETSSSAIWKELGIAGEMEDALNQSAETMPAFKLHPALSFGLGAFVLVQLVPLLSLPPVLWRRGAPYLPTFQNQAEAMFRLLRSEPSFQQRIASGKQLRFVDLGSGDGRLVFRAAQARIFALSSGYEINPLLHGIALTQKLLYGPHYWTSTSFIMKDIWKTDLRNTHVVAVYGLGPIMGKLGQKLKQELPDESFVLSNTFTFPGWTHTKSDKGVYVYQTPHCWKPGQQTVQASKCP